MSAPLDPDMFTECRVAPMPVWGAAKWGAKIMRCLDGGPRRFTELQVPLRGVTAKVLAESLRALERDGIVRRTAYAEMPPRVEYALTPLGRSMFEPMDAWCAWAERHLAELLQAREGYEGH